MDECTVVLCVSFPLLLVWTGSMHANKQLLQTDDVGVFGSPLSNEYRLVAEHFGLSESEIRALARKGIEVIFGGEEEKQRLRQIMAP